MGLACLGLTLGLLLQAATPTEELALRVTEILQREPEPADEALALAARELAGLAGVTPVLIDVVGRARSPAPDDARLGPRQLELARQALQRSGGEELAAFLRAVEKSPDTPERIAAAMRIVARRTGRDGLAALTRLARGAERGQLFDQVEEVFEQSMGELLAADPSRVQRLQAPFVELSPAAATVAVRAVGRLGTADALACLRTQLGHRAELEAPVLLELARLAHVADVELARELSQEAVSHLRSRSAEEVQAAASLLGRLAVPSSVPALIEGLAHEDPRTVRASLSGLRAIGGVGLAASPEAWRAWYAREETWWLDRAPELFAPLEPTDEARTLAELSARLREISEHRLHRHEIVARLVPFLSHRWSSVRVLVCEGLGRLGSPRALGPLESLLEDPSAEVVAAARAALSALAGDARSGSSRRRPAS